MFRTGEGSGGASLTFRHAFPAALTASSAVLPVDFNEKLFHRLVDYTTVCPAGRQGGFHLPQRSGSQHGDLY